MSREGASGTERIPKWVGVILLTLCSALAGGGLGDLRARRAVAESTAPTLTTEQQQLLTDIGREWRSHATRLAAVEKQADGAPTRREFDDLKAWMQRVEGKLDKALEERGDRRSLGR